MPPPSFWDYGQAREAECREIFADPRFAFADFLEPLFQTLPFKLGESAAATIIPYALDDLISGALERAIDSLVELLARRREEQLGAPPGSHAAHSEIPLGCAHHSLAPFADHPLALVAARQAMHSDALLDAGLTHAWILNAPGGELLSQLSALYAKCFAEDVKDEGRVHRLHLSWTAVLDAVEAAKERAKPHVSRALPWDRLEKALGLACFCLARAAIAPVLKTLEKRHFNFDATAYRRALYACLSPLAGCSIQTGALRDDLNPWGLTPNLADDLERLWFGLLEIDPRADRAAERLLHEINTQPTLRTRAAQAGAIQELRELTFAWLDQCHGVDDELVKALDGHLTSNAALFRHLSDPRALQTSLRHHAESPSVDEQARAASERLLERLHRGFDSERDVQRVARSFVCWSIDRATAHTLSRARGLLRDLRRTQGASTLTEAYARGRLYRLSADRQPTLSALSVAAQGHLFVDLKGFTQRTYRAKEIDMADFLRTEFYEPILAAAAQCGGQARGEARLCLQNLPGDAAIFSGELPALIDLAQEIWRVHREYSRKLDKRLSSASNALKKRRQEVQSRLREQLEAFDVERRRLQDKIDAEGRLTTEENDRLRQHRAEAEIAAVEARTHVADIEAEERELMLEAGLFISYGAAAEVAHLDSPVFGSIQVAVAEKINEAARGTARNDALRERIEERLAQERHLRENPTLALPFRVHIGPDFRMNLPPALGDKMERAIKDRDMGLARDIAQNLAQAIYADMARAMSRDDSAAQEALGLTDQIYNTGEALSEEALFAWLTATSARRHYLRRVVAVDSLDAEIRKRFLFLSTDLDLTISLPIGGPLEEALIFRRVGQVQFRGFESKDRTTVYEMIRRCSPFARLIVERHLPQWAAEATARRAGHT